MAKIEVGMQLKWQNKPVICTSISTLTDTCYALQSSFMMRSSMHEPVNIKILVEEWDDFDEGDIITIESQRLQLTEVGKNLFFVYSYYKVHKESLDGPKRCKESDRQASDAETETDRRRPEGGESSGEQSPNQDSNSSNRDGSSGGGGLSSDSKVGEEGEHATSINGDSDSSGAGSSLSPLQLAIKRALSKRVC